MKIRHLEFAVKSYENDKAKKAHKLRDVSEKVDAMKRKEKKEAQSFRSVRDSLLKGQGEGGERELLMKLLLAKKQKLGSVSQKKEKLGEELLRVQKDLAKIAKKKEKVGELLAAKRDAVELLKSEAHTEQDSVLYYISSEKEQFTNEVQQEPLDGFSGMAELKEVKQRELLASRKTDLPFDSVQTQVETYADATSLSQGGDYQGEHSSSQNVFQDNGEQSSQPSPQQTFDQLCERLAQMESWQSGDASHFHCSYRLSSGSEIGLQVQRQHDGKLKVLLISHRERSSIELSHGMRNLSQQLREAGFTDVSLELRDASQRRVA